MLTVCLLLVSILCAQSAQNRFVGVEGNDLYLCSDLNGAVLANNVSIASMTDVESLENALNSLNERLDQLKSVIRGRTELPSLVRLVNGGSGTITINAFDVRRNGLLSPQVHVISDSRIMVVYGEGFSVRAFVCELSTGCTSPVILHGFASELRSYSSQINSNDHLVVAASERAKVHVLDCESLEQCSGQSFLADASSVSLQFDKTDTPSVVYCGVNGVFVESANAKNKNIFGSPAMDCQLQLLNNTPYVAFRTAVDLSLVICTDPSCDSTKRSILSSTRVDHVSSLQINSLGQPMIAFVESQNLTIAICDDDECPTETVHRSTLQTGGLLQHLDLAIQQGNPIISFQNQDNTELILAMCQDTICDDAQLRTIDGIGFQEQSGFGTSLAIDSKGNPIVATTSGAQNGIVRILFCADPTCL